MVSLKVLIPEATVNYVKNPALRYDTTDWNAQGSSITRSLDQARFGNASLKVVTAGSAQREGAYFRVSSLTGVSEAITVSAYVRGAGKVRIRLDNNVIGGAEYASQAMVLKADRWQRIQMTGFSTGGNDLRLYVETDEGSAVVRTFYIDGAQMERKITATTYCDGEQEGCRWNGVYDASTSQREADTRAGGSWVQLAGPEREAEDLYMTVAGGLGFAPLSNNVQSYALEPGGFFQDSKIGMRTITLTFHAKHHVDDRDDPISLNHLHELRQFLIDLVKPDRTGGEEELRFEYRDGDTALYFRARYDGGLEGEWDIRNQFVNSFPLRLLAVAPIFEEDNRNVQALDWQQSLAVNYVMRRKDTGYDHLNFGMNNQCYDLAIDPRGRIYVVGAFTVVNNHAAAIDPLRPCAGIAYFDGEKWVALATSLGGTASISSVAVDTRGYVYVGGPFTSINGVAAAKVAYWDGSNWNAMGTGITGTRVNKIAVAPNGDVYVGGDFTAAGGVSDCRNVARWDGSSWHRLGQYMGLNNEVWELQLTKDGSLLYVAGDFTDEYGNPGTGLNYVARYNTETGFFSAMGNGVTNPAIALIVSDSGQVYIPGYFSGSINNVVQWNGSTWIVLGSGFTFGGGVATIYNLALDQDQNLIAVGQFTDAGGNDARGYAIWNGSSWISTDLALQGNLLASDFFEDAVIDPGTHDLYIAGSFSSANYTYIFSDLTTVENTGSMEVKPVIYLHGPARLIRLENITNQKKLYFNLTILPDEDVYIDIGKGTIYSTLRGSLFFAMLPGSDFRSFTLLPGDNQILAFMTQDMDAKMYISYVPLHWSADATQRIV